MCGIVACHTRQPALDFLLPGLARLEYRGYDSAGVAVTSDGGDIVRLRSIGHLESLERRIAGHTGPQLNGVGIGHTRWATHGMVTENNTHPHTDCARDVHVVHNGIIENALALRDELKRRGHIFSSDVDSEVIAHLVEDELRVCVGTLFDVVNRITSRLIGSWAIAAISRRDRVVVVTAHRSPLVVAHTDVGSFAASDAAALVGWSVDSQVLEDGDVVELRDDGIRWRRADGSSSQPTTRHIVEQSSSVVLGDAPDYMAKEISEQAARADALIQRLEPTIANGKLWEELGLRSLQRVRFVACGTSLNAAAVLARFLGKYGVPATLAPASELEHVVLEPGTLAVALSQSGETADVLRAIAHHPPDVPLLALTNVSHSTLARTADAVLDLGVGTEIGVAATKTFTAQIIAGSSVLLSGLVRSGRLDRATAEELVSRLRQLPQEMELSDDFSRQHVPSVARAVRDAAGFLFVARGAAVPYAAEGALKLKEISYRWAEFQPAGELKHGPIALIEPGTPVVAIDDGHPKLAGNLAEMEARQAHIILVGGTGSTLAYRDGSSPVPAPWGPLPAILPLQRLARELALVLGRDVDKPRNLAKCVTVE